MTVRKNASAAGRERRVPVFRTALTGEKGSVLLWIVLTFSFVGILAGWGLSLYKAPTENRARMETVDQLETVKQAFYGYAKTYKLLPRPASSSAENGTAAGVVTTNLGHVPWYDLGVKPKDAWGRKLKYDVWHDKMCVSTQTACGALSSYKQNIPPDGITKVQLRDGYANNMLRYVPAIILSTGPGDAGGDDGGALEDGAAGGYNAPLNFFTPYARSAPTPTFDDILVYLDPFVLYDVMDCHCRNGVKDEDETGVDCGGSDCASCP